MNAEEARVRVLEWIDTHREDVVRFLQDLLRIPSVNPWFGGTPGLTGERDVQAVIARRVKALGATVEQWEPEAKALAKYAGRPGYYPDRDFKARPNLAARIDGAASGRSLLLFGHIDVVKAGTGWSVDPFGAVRRDGRVYGRGALDMKGGVAAMVIAAEAIIRTGLKPAGALLIGTVVDEEAGGMGTLAFVDRGYRADACILTEPTDLAIAPLCRGILWGKMTLPGRSGHIEMPQGDWRTGGAVDAIDKLHLFLDQFKRLNADWARRKTHPLLPIPCQLHVAQVQAGEYPTTFANRAEVIFNAQYLPSEQDSLGLGGGVKREIEEYVQHVGATDAWLQEHPPTIEWLIDADCGETPADHEFVRCCMNSVEHIGCGSKLEGICSHTDMGWPVRVGIPTVNFGPGNPRMAHQSDEYVEEASLLNATRMIASTILDWCGVVEA